MQNNISKILIVDDNEDVLLAAKLLLKPHVTVIRTEKDPSQLPRLLDKETFDVIFLDMNFTQDMTSGKEGFYWLKEILKTDPSAVVILITAYGDVDTAVKAIKEGATDFVLKPWQNEKFIATLSSALKLRESRIELEKLRSRQHQLSADMDSAFHDLIGKSGPMQAVYATIQKVAATEANVLILGENGTGKELVARALHKQSKRASEVFISIDMGTLTPTLFESELFGHVKGAFTDAKDDRAGRFEIASGGTLFLDEIGNIPPELQAKLLTVLQKREITRVGANKAVPIDIRLICATNMPIHQYASDKKFRQDLLYRINTVEILIPPLRERKDDIPVLSEYFLSIFAKKYNKSCVRFDAGTVFKLVNYSWPGNVRELQHAIERAVILCDSDLLLPSDFMFSSKSSSDFDELQNYNLDETEKNIIIKALLKHNGNITHAANEMGITRTALYRRMKKYNL
jgi:DNA-binding NtrC family response regulator